MLSRRAHYPWLDLIIEKALLLLGALWDKALKKSKERIIQFRKNIGSTLCVIGFSILPMTKASQLKILLLLGTLWAVYLLIKEIRLLTSLS